MSTVMTGLERLLAEPGLRRGLRRVALLVNHTAVDRRLRHALALLPEAGLQVARVFGPEHGVWGVAQDMVAVDGAVEPLSGAPAVSLYGRDEASLRPAARLLADVDALVYDIQDIGSRYYTYAATLVHCMRACAEAGTPCVVLDRPNPLGGQAWEGNLVPDALRSFVGLLPVPQRHGLTVGELAMLANDRLGLGCALRVVPCQGWRRAQWHDQTGQPWVMPSPNMPTLDTATVYPGACLLEATQLSEGRGTTRPFELCGAPHVDPFALARALEALALPGVAFRPCFIQPTFHKHAGQACGAVQLHVTDRDRFEPLVTGLALLWQVRRLWPGAFAWRAEPYEFRADVPAIDLLAGTAEVRTALEAGLEFSALHELALAGGERFAQERQPFLLYE